MNNIRIKPNPYMGICPVEFTWQGENTPTYFVMAGLYVDGEAKIFWINEVYNTCDVTLGTKAVDEKESVSAPPQ